LAQPVELPATSDKHSLADLSLEELMNETITSVSKREQKLGDAAAAIFVLSHDDLRRSGATSVAEALRLVPGMVVGSVNASQWAVSARGFSGVFTNKLLVLVDGRAVYTPLFAGVYWDLQQTMLEDVDRIEVIRGPGATIWGANAVNGVVNIVTRSAEETQGGMIYGGGGDVHQAMGGVRYGGRMGEKAHYRVFASYESNAAHPQADGRSARDAWHLRQGGFRLDHDPQPGTHLTWQAEGTGLDLDRHASDAYNVNTLARWTRESSERSSTEVQTYYDRTYRNEAMRSRNTIDTLDLTGQRTVGLGARHDLIWGFGCRLIESTVEAGAPGVEVRNTDHSLRLFSAFVQDEVRVVPDRLTLTAGVKLEHNDFTGLEVQPSLRAVFKPTEMQTVWAAASRAVRTPSEVEGRDLFAIAIGPPVSGPDGGLYVPTVVGNTDITAEILSAYELGYRSQPARTWNLDLAAFYNDYSRLIGFSDVTRFIPGTPVGTAEIPWSNLLSGVAYGGEALVTLSPTAVWRLTAGYAQMRVRIRGPAAAAQGFGAQPPRHQLVLRASHDLTRQVSLDAQVRYVDPILSVARYATADLRLSYRATDRLELSLVGQNLFDGQHPEQPSFPITVTTEVPRGFHLKIVRRF
jgi:iron complex outermembrane receptor protein